MPSLRTLGAIVVGLIAGVMVISLLQVLGLLAHPMPEGLDPQDREALREHAAQAPPLAKAIVVASWVLGALIGSFLAARLSTPGDHWYGLVTGALLLVGTVVTLFQLPSGAGMAICGVALPPVASWLGCRAGKRPPEAPA